MKAQFERDQAAVLMVEALYIAATYDQEQAVATYLSDALEKRQLTLRHLQQQFIPNATDGLPAIETTQHSLDSYDQLLCHTDKTEGDDKTDDNLQNDNHCQPLPTAEQPTQTAQTHSHAYPLGSYREPRFAATMVLCTILTQLVSAGGRQTGALSAKTRKKRSSAARRKKFNDL